MGTTIVLIASWFIWLLAVKRSYDNISRIDKAYNDGEMNSETHAEGRSIAQTQRRFILLAGVFLVMFNLIIFAI